VVGELCGCNVDGKESHGYKMGGIRVIVEVIILFHMLRSGEAHEVALPSTRTGTRGAIIHLLVQEAIHQVGHLFGRARGGGEVPWRNFHPYL
jgi:hypothetical protein